MKLIVYLLIFQFSIGAVFPNNDYTQWSNIQYLLEHYQLHVEEAELEGVDFGIIDFIYLHYISPDEHTHELPFDHEELPLKNITSQVFLFFKNIINFQFVDLNQSPVNEAIRFIDDSFSFNYLARIFHPPVMKL